MTDLTQRTAPDEGDRENVLRYASGLMTGRGDPHIILPVADHLLTWLARGQPGTVHQRARAMARQYSNILCSLTVGECSFTDDPDAFLDAAAQYVPFLAGVSA